MTDMVLVFGECHQNSAQAAQQYALRYPARGHPGRGYIHRIVERLRQTGSFHLRRRGVQRNIGRPPAQTEDVRRQVTANPHTSTRAVARQIGRSKSLVYKILKKPCDGAHQRSLQQIFLLQGTANEELRSVIGCVTR